MNIDKKCARVALLRVVGDFWWSLASFSGCDWRVVLLFGLVCGLLQRCQVHEIRNVTSHLSEEYRHAVKCTMNAAYTSLEHAEAKRILDRLHPELMHRNPSAARSLAEGLEESLTVHRLRVGSILRETMATTNPIESAFSIVDTICRNVKRWQGGDQYLRWVASGLVHAGDAL